MQPSESPERAPIPQPPENQPFWKRPKVLLFVAFALVLLTAGLLAGAWALRNNSPSLKSGSESAVFTNWLEPKSEIVVGKNRYVSACQAYGKDDYATTFNGFGDDTIILENYYDRSPNLNEESYETLCSFVSLANGGGTVSVRAKQFVDVADARAVYSSLSVGNDVNELKQRNAIFKTAVDTSYKEPLKDLVAKMESSALRYESARNAFKPLTESQTDGFLVPAGQGLFEFEYIYKNVVYSIELETPFNTSDRKPTNEQSLQMLTYLDSVLSSLISNVTQSNLSQSPAPTILSNKQKIGTTYILEPCVILSKSVFQEVIGLEQNSSIGKTTTPYNIEKERTYRATKSPRYPSNTCERTYDLPRAGTFGPSKTVRFSLRLDQAPSVEKQVQALSAPDSYLPLRDGSAELETDADWAIESARSDGSKGYVFRVGPYLGTVSILTTEAAGPGSDIVQTRETREQAIKAINLLVPSLKTHLDEVKKADP